jgi:hypothetical protein
MQFTITVGEPTWPLTFSSLGLGVGHSLQDQSIYMLDFFQGSQVGAGDYTLRQSIPGSPLQFNWDNAATASDVNGRTVLSGGTRDFMFATESVPFRHVQAEGYSRATNTFSAPKTSGSARDVCDPRAWIDYHNLAAANGVTRFFVYEVWHDTRGGLGGAEQAAYLAEDSGNPFTDVLWRDMINTAAPFWAEFVTMLRSGPSQGTHPALGYTETVTPGTQVFLIPGGSVLAAIYDAIQAGGLPAGVTYTDFFADFFEDSIHPLIPGRYAVACAMYAVIFRQSPVGLPSATQDIFGGNYADVGTANAAWLQQIAWDTVQAHPLTGL